jgi:hypothetical protein
MRRMALRLTDRATSVSPNRGHTRIDDTLDVRLEPHRAHERKRGRFFRGKERGEVFLGIDRENIYQVVFDNFYYNVANNQMGIFGFRPTVVRSFLKGTFNLINRPDETNVGEPRLNVVDLEFGDNGVRLGAIPRHESLVELVKKVEYSRLSTLPVPGPKGITGELWNLYLDDELRISAGVQDDNGVRDLYILRRVETAAN